MNTKVLPNLIALLFILSLASNACVGTDIIQDSNDGNETPPDTLTVNDTLRTGMFEKRPGTSYDVKGTAVLEMGQAGKLVLRFANDFRSSNGPGLHVILSGSNSVNSQSRDLGNLQSTSGIQTYDLPADLTIKSYDWVIIHCVPFNVTFGYAQFQ